MVDDSRLNFGVIHICSPGFNWIAQGKRNSVLIGGGVSLRKVLDYCKSNGLGGAEFLAGIPGTIGGAVAGNAGARGMSVESLINYITVIDRKGRRHRLNTNDIDFSYRNAGGLEEMIITEVELELPPRSPELVSRLIKKNIEKKKSAQPTSKPNAGCIFKNPGQYSAGKLLDTCGFKGWARGGAKVSEEHANFICNHQHAASKDVMFMIEEMKKAVKERFGIELELEVKLWTKDESAKVA